MKAVKIVLEPTSGWHIRDPATYRVERTYPIIPPTVLFGIIQNLLFTSSHKTKFRSIIALGGFPRSDIGLSLEMERIVKIKDAKKGKIVTDRHEIEVVHSDKIDAYTIVPGDYVDDYFPLLESVIGDVVHLTTPQFPAIVREVKVCEAKEIIRDKMLFALSHNIVLDGMPYVLPLRYEFPKKEEYRAQKYERVLLPYKILSPAGSSHILKKSQIILKEKIDVICIDDVCFDKKLLKKCNNMWHPSIQSIVGTI